MSEEKELLENERKKEYLNQYRSHVSRIHRIEAEIAEVRDIKMHPSVSYDGMPRGSGKNDLSGYAARLDKLERDLCRERYLRVKSYMDISARIKKLKDPRESDTLFYRYVKGLDWWEIAEKIGYCERQIHRYHGKALTHFELPEDVMECQD